MRGREALNDLKCLAIGRKLPKPCFLNFVPAVVQNPDQVVPLEVVRLRHERDETSGFSAWTIGFDLISRTVELEVMAALYCRHALHGACVFFDGEPTSNAASSSDSAAVM